MKRPLLTILLATVLWTIMFSPLTAPHVNFWLMMSASALTLSVLSTLFRPGWLKEVKLSPENVLSGIALAAALWGVFWIGDKFSSMLFHFARPEVDAIYAIKTGASPVTLSLLMLLLIGPAEEIFWRGYIQHSLSNRWGKNTGWIVTTAIYALVHLGSGNFMLVMSAGVAGALWGTLYRFYPERFAAILISHAVWDAAVFIWFPI